MEARNMAESLEKKYLTEACIEEWWGQTDEDPFDFANEYNLTCEPLKYNRDEVLYRFTGTDKDIERAKSNGYFCFMDYSKDECYSKGQVRRNLGIPGTGIYSSEVINKGSKKETTEVVVKKSFYKRASFYGVVIAALAVFGLMFS